MKTVLIIFTAVVLSISGGCQQRTREKGPCNTAILAVHGQDARGTQLLTVDFQKDQTLRYKFVSSREIEITWEPTKTTSKRGKDSVSKSIESMEMVVAYTPIKIDPYGLTTIKAACESVKARRSPLRRAGRKDAVESLPGKTFTLTIGPTGKIEDYSQLNKIIREIGNKAFRPDTSRGRVKEPDMICDFIATQRFLWDSISSLEKPSEGVRVGQSWESQLSVPGPMVMNKARDVTYSLSEIRRSEKGQLAVIHSSYGKAKSVPRGWILPYSGSFQMSGTFGFLRGYKILDLKGEGEELFNIDKGRIEQYNQQYQVQMEASLLMALGPNPRITIKQNLTMQLLENATSK